MRCPSKPLPPGRPPSRLLIHSALMCDMIMQIKSRNPDTQACWKQVTGHRAQGTETVSGRYCLLISQVPATTLVSRSFHFAFQSPPRPPSQPPPKQQRQPLAPILIITLGHFPGTTCAHNPWILLMLISHRPSWARSIAALSHLPTTTDTDTDTDTDTTMPTGAIPRMSLPTTEKQQATGGLGYPAHPAFYIAYEFSSHALPVLVPSRPVLFSPSPAQNENSG